MFNLTFLLSLQSDPPIRCEKCSIVFDLYSDLNQHKKCHSSDKKVMFEGIQEAPCYICNFKSHSLEVTQEHLFEVHNITSLACLTCKINFDSLAHVLRHHKQKANHSYICLKCLTLFRSVRSFIKHQLFARCERHEHL